MFNNCLSKGGSAMYPNNDTSRDAKVRPEPDREIAGMIREKHLRLLVVDDNDEYRRAMTFNLNVKYGADVTAVNSGLEAISEVRAGNRYDLTFLDIMMARMNGIETYLELKKLDPDSSIVLMSAYSGSKEWAEAL